uniref:Uncharacterized protein n=1 Tax=Oryza barthii TaxID=65489 RepID=A0A0D3HT04_9ORYZ
MVGAEGWRRLMRRCSSYRGCSSSTNGGRGRGVGGCVKATAYARVTRVGDDGMDETLLSNLPYNSDHGYSLRFESSCKKSAWIDWDYTKFLDYMELFGWAVFGPYQIPP